MLHNLEAFNFDEVINGEKVSYAVFRDGLKPHYARVWFDIVKGYAGIAAAVAGFVFLNHHYPSLWWLFIIPVALLIGYIAAYLALFIHEAGHYNIHPDKKMNDRLATIFLCLPFGLSMRSYRKIHWQHHLHLGTPDDAEHSYFNAVTGLFLLESLTGIHLLKTITKKNSSILLNKEQVKLSRLMLLAGGFLHLLFLAALLWMGQWAMAIAWIMAFGIFFPFFATIRQILEHRDELATHEMDFFKQPHGKLSRLFRHTLLSSSFGAAGFTRHLIHHWDPQLSYTRLGEAEQFLEHCDKTSALLQSSRTSYSQVFKKLWKAP